MQLEDVWIDGAHTHDLALKYAKALTLFDIIIRRTDLTEDILLVKYKI